MYKFNNLCNIAWHKFLKLPEDVIEMSKHVRMIIV